MVKIAVIITGLGIGGAELLQLSIVKDIDRKKFVLEVFCIYDENNSLIPYFLAEGASVRVIKVFDYSKHFLFRVNIISILRLVRMLKKGNYDIVHTHLPHANTIGRIAAILAGRRPNIATIHNMDYRSKVQLIWDRILGKRSYKIMCVSDSVMQYDMQHTGFSQDKYVVVHNGIDIHKFSKRGLSKLSKGYLGLPDEAFVIGSVGRLDKRKDFPTLLQAFSIIEKKIPNAFLVIAGDGPEKKHLERLGKELGIMGKVKLLGSRLDVPEILSCLDVFVLSSTFEGFGNSLIEAMSMGLPVVATDLPPINEIISDQEDGLIVPVRNPYSIASSIQKIYNSPRLRIKLGKNARSKVTRLFSHVAMVKKLETLYHDAMDTTRK